MKDYPHHLTKMKARGNTSKVPIFKFFTSDLANIWKCSLQRPIQKSQFSISFVNWVRHASIHSPRPTCQIPNFKSMDALGKRHF